MATIRPNSRFQRRLLRFGRPDRGRWRGARLVCGLPQRPHTSLPARLRSARSSWLPQWGQAMNQGVGVPGDWVVTSIRPQNSRCFAAMGLPLDRFCAVWRCSESKTQLSSSLLLEEVCRRIGRPRAPPAWLRPGRWGACSFSAGSDCFDDVFLFGSLAAAFCHGPSAAGSGRAGAAEPLGGLCWPWRRFISAQ